MAIISTKPIASAGKTPAPVKEKVTVSVQYAALFKEADKIAAEANLRLTEIEKELKILEAEKVTTKNIISDIARYNLGS